MEITINALQNSTKLIYVSEEAITVADVLAKPEVVNFFDEEADVIQGALTAFQGQPVPEAFASIILASEIASDASIDIDLEGNPVEGEESEQEAAAPAEDGFVTVAAGLTDCAIRIHSGATVKQVLSDPEVEARLGVTQSWISTRSVVLDGEIVQPCALESTRVNPGSTITLNPRAAHDKGAALAD